MLEYRTKSDTNVSDLDATLSDCTKLNDCQQYWYLVSRISGLFQYQHQQDAKIYEKTNEIKWRRRQNLMQEYEKRFRCNWNRMITRKINVSTNCFTKISNKKFMIFKRKLNLSCGSRISIISISKLVQRLGNHWLLENWFSKYETSIHQRSQMAGIKKKQQQIRYKNVKKTVSMTIDRYKWNTTTY